MPAGKCPLGELPVEAAETEEIPANRLEQHLRCRALQEMAATCSVFTMTKGGRNEPSLGFSGPETPLGSVRLSLGINNMTSPRKGFHPIFVWLLCFKSVS